MGLFQPLFLGHSKSSLRLTESIAPGYIVGLLTVEEQVQVMSLLPKQWLLESALICEVHLQYHKLRAAI